MGQKARAERTGGTPIPQLCVNYLIHDPQDAESDRAEIAGTKSIQALQTEITALPTEIQAGFTKRFQPVNC